MLAMTGFVKNMTGCVLNFQIPKKNYVFGATTRIGREIQCLLQAGFFLYMTRFVLNMNIFPIHMTEIVQKEKKTVYLFSWH